MTTDFGGLDEGRAVALQANGKIVVAGFANNNGGIRDFALARYNSDGSLDTGFGIGGKVTTDFSGNDEGYAVALQADGKIVVAGYTDNGSGYGDFALARYNTDGSLDTGFGTGGKVMTDFGCDDGGYAVAVQADGKIVVAGFSYIYLALVRYNNDGSLDTGFGTGGEVMGGEFYGYAVALQADGKIVVAGSNTLVRYNSNGSLDTGFGTGGEVMVGEFYGYAVALQADGKIVVAGYTDYGSNRDFALARYNTDGSLDTGFGTGGKVMTDFGGLDEGHAVALQANGKIVVAGYTYYGEDFALARYNSDGSLDTGFGIGGKVTTDFGGNDEGYAVALQADSKIVVAGFSDCDFALARYNVSGPTPTPTSTITGTPMATVTPTSTLTPSATITPSGSTLTPTVTVTQEPLPNHVYLPLVVR